MTAFNTHNWFLHYFYFQIVRKTLTVEGNLPNVIGQMISSHSSNVLLSAVVGTELFDWIGAGLASCFSLINMNKIHLKVKRLLLIVIFQNVVNEKTSSDSQGSC